MAIEIPLTQGQVTVIDDCDSDLAGFKWWANYEPTINRYDARRKQQMLSQRTTLLMHRVILSRMLGRKLERHELVDHKDLNSLNNRRKNLRLASNSENLCNRRKTKANKSGRKGVFWNKSAKKWHAQIRVDGKPIYLGVFDNIEDAAEAYRVAAIKYHGEFARWEEDD